jgi:NAD(P)H-dependent FMN reductase
MKVLVFAGSTRGDSVNKKLAKAAGEELRHAGLDTTLVDLRDYPMPLYDGDAEAAEGMPERAWAFRELVRSHDALAIASPEYNGSFPALVKNTIDWISRPHRGEPHLAALRGKTAMLMSASPGGGGGRRGIRHLRELLDMIGVHVIAESVIVPRSGEAFGTDGELLRAEDREALRHAADALAAAVRANVAIA